MTNIHSKPKIPWPVAAWLVICAFLNCVGWILSALHQLNVAGYTVAFVVAAAVVFLARKEALPQRRRFQFQRLRRRFSRAYPAAFLVLAVLVLAGGALHLPANYDGLAYREPRVLHWLAEGRWHWISTDFHRLNVRACGFEWLSAPLILFTRTDRLVFLINFISFLLLPGLVFSLFVELGIQRRAAWYWMWLLPSGYCFLLQAGGIANDAFSAVFALAAIVFAFRARASQRIGYVWLSCLAAALLTGTKTSNLPMLLPWCIAMLPLIPLVLKHMATGVGVAIVAAGCSFLPVAALNLHYCGDWTGQAAEQAWFGRGERVLHVTHNALLVAVDNLVPPMFPAVNAWKRLVLKTIPQERLHRLEQSFEPDAVWLSVPEMQSEESAGLGFGLSVLSVITFIATVRSRRRKSDGNLPPGPWLLRIAVLAGVWVSLVPLLAVSGASGPSRYLAPQYALLVAPFLLNQTGDWIRAHRWWRWAGLFVFLMGAGLVVLSPARPLWPARAVLARLESSSGTNAMIKRAQTVYAVYGQRGDALASFRNLLPADATTVGMVTFDDPETSLWRPFGSRRVCHVLPQDTREDLDKRGVGYVLISYEHFSQRFGEPLEQWEERMHAVVVKQATLTLHAGWAPADWYLVKLLPLR